MRAISSPRLRAATCISAIQVSGAGTEVNVTGSITKGMGDVRDLDVSPDGTTIVFSLRLPLNPKKTNADVDAAELAHLYCTTPRPRPSLN